METFVAVRGDSAAVLAHTPGARLVAWGSDAPGDVALVEAGVEVGPGWLEGLRAALGDDGTVATVSAVTAPVLPERALAPLRLRIPEPTWRCTLVTRAALDLAGPLDEGFAARCSEAGLLHVVAGEVVVREADAPASLLEPLARATRRAREVADGISLTVDARILREPMAGTQVHALELLAALQRTGQVRLRALLPPSPQPAAQVLLDRLDGIEWLNSDDVTTDTAATALVHRPYQVSGALDLLTLRQVGERLVLTHQDLLNYHQPAYHPDQETFESHRRLTRAGLAAAARVVAFSHHAGADLLAEELVRPDRLRVVEIGVDHRLHQLAEPRAPQPAPAQPFLLCIGTDLRHKNQPFALALTQALNERGWDGTLVLAGSHARHGTSERLHSVTDLGAVTEDEKAWLYANAAAVVYPTVYEGFGLVPFEAAERGTPCLFAPQAALAETLPDSATLIPWDAHRSADRVRPLLEPGPAREAHVAAIRAAAARYTWDRTAQELVQVYEEALAVGPTDEAWVALEAEARRGHWEGMYWKLFQDVGPSGMALVGPDGALEEPARRALAALVARKVTRRPVLAALNALGRRTS